MTTTRRWRVFRSSSDLGLRRMLKAGRLRVLSLNVLLMKVVVGREVSIGCLLRGIEKLKPLTRTQSKPRAQTCSPSSARCRITTDSGSLLGLLDMVSLIQWTVFLLVRRYLLTFLHRHAPNPPLNSQHHALYPRISRFQPLCPGSCDPLPFSAKAFPSDEGESREVARDRCCKASEAY